MADVKKFIDEIKTMTVLELNELVKALEEEFGVSACFSATACNTLTIPATRLLSTPTKLDTGA